MRKKHKQNVRFNLRITSQLHEALKLVAKQAGLSVSGLVRLGMHTVIEKYGQENGQMEQGKGEA